MTSDQMVPAWVTHLAIGACWKKQRTLPTGLTAQLRPTHRMSVHLVRRRDPGGTCCALLALKQQTTIQYRSVFVTIWRGNHTAGNHAKCVRESCFLYEAEDERTQLVGAIGLGHEARGTCSGTSSLEFVCFSSNDLRGQQPVASNCPLCLLLSLETAQNRKRGTFEPNMLFKMAACILHLSISNIHTQVRLVLLVRTTFLFDRKEIFSHVHAHGLWKTRINSD